MQSLPGAHLRRVADRIKAHLDAGASHVSVQVLDADQFALPMNQWRELATVLANFA
ncbi:hypothetical protein EMGBS4_08020 [Acidimicrobiaceae bacterium]|nr:hypothetical protein EMGBS4_08020 [Acidimicrobiaceae bacterium]